MHEVVAMLLGLLAWSVVFVPFFLVWWLPGLHTYRCCASAIRAERPLFRRGFEWPPSEMAADRMHHATSIQCGSNRVVGDEMSTPITSQTHGIATGSTDLPEWILQFSGQLATPIGNRPLGTHREQQAHRARRSSEHRDSFTLARFKNMPAPRGQYCLRVIGRNRICVHLRWGRIRRVLGLEPRQDERP